MNLRDVSSFLNVHCLQRKLLGWKGRIFQNMTVITICSWWKASSLMGGYPAWFLCVAHPLPVPISNRKGLKQRREEHWLPGNCNTKWRNSGGELWYKQTSLSDLSCDELWVTMQNRVLRPQVLLAQTGGEVMYQMRWTWHERTKKAKFEAWERQRQHHIKYLFCLSKLWVSPLAVSPSAPAGRRAIIFPKYLCLFEHLLIRFSHSDGNLDGKVASPLHDLPFCLKLARCQVSTTFSGNPVFSLGFSRPVVKAMLSPVKEHRCTTWQLKKWGYVRELVFIKSRTL